MELYILGFWLNAIYFFFFFLIRSPPAKLQVNSPMSLTVEGEFLKVTLSAALSAGDQHS